VDILFLRGWSLCQEFLPGIFQHIFFSKSENLRNAVTVCTFLQLPISANSFRGNYSFLNLTLCTVTFDYSTYRCGNYLREETIQGRKLFAEIRYMKLMKAGHCHLRKLARTFL
jgi:hypothetical protein